MVTTQTPKFRLFLQQVMVDSLLVQSSESNCLQDGGYFLLTLNSMSALDREYTYPTFDQAPGAGDSMPHPTTDQVPADGDSVPDPVLIALAFNLPSEDVSMQEKNILTYIAGYIARKMKGRVCDSCVESLVGELEGTQKEIFLTTKKYSDLRGDGLVVPSAQLVSVVEQLEIVFKKSEHFLHMNMVRARFLQRMEKDSTCLVCPEAKCKLAQNVLNLFLNIRLHFTLKENNRNFAAASGRQNRKMLKLQHL